MRTICALLLCLCVVVPCWGKAEAPVTQAEAAAVFTKADQVMKSVIKYKATAPAFPASTAIATRGQVLRHLNALVEAVQPKFKFKLPRQPSAPAVISFKDPALKQMAERLESLGFIDRYGPLVTSKAEGLQPDDFGDAVGYFIARIADMTHMPSWKFTPFLMPG
jgi:hypothetical protein